MFAMGSDSVLSLTFPVEQVMVMKQPYVNLSEVKAPPDVKPHRQTVMLEDNKMALESPSPKTPPVRGDNETIRKKLRESLVAALEMVVGKQVVKSVLGVGKESAEEEREGKSSPSVEVKSQGEGEVLPVEENQSATLTSANEGVGNAAKVEDVEGDLQVAAGSIALADDKAVVAPGESHDEVLESPSKKAKSCEEDGIQVAEETKGGLQLMEQVTRVAWDIEENLFLAMGGVNKKYKEKARSLLFNLKDKSNPELRARVFSGEIAPQVLARMTGEQLASKELSQWRTAKAEAFASMVVLTDADVDPRRIVKKTHKGEFQVMTEQPEASVDVIEPPTYSFPAIVKKGSEDGGKVDQSPNNGAKSSDLTKSQEDKHLDRSIEGGGAGDGAQLDLPTIMSLDEYIDTREEAPSQKSESSLGTENGKNESKTNGVKEINILRTPTGSPTNLHTTVKITKNPSAKNTEGNSNAVSLYKKRERESSSLLWEGSVQLSATRLAPVDGFLKSGERLELKDWPKSVEIKGRVRLSALDKFLQDLQLSRSRTVTVLSLCPSDRQGADFKQAQAYLKEIRSVVLEWKLSESLLGVGRWNSKELSEVVRSFRTVEVARRSFPEVRNCFVLFITLAVEKFYSDIKESGTLVVVTSRGDSSATRDLSLHREWPPPSGHLSSPTGVPASTVSENGPCAMRESLPHQSVELDDGPPGFLPRPSSSFPLGRPAVNNADTKGSVPVFQPPYLGGMCGPASGLPDRAGETVEAPPGFWRSPAVKAPVASHGLHTSSLDDDDDDLPEFNFESEGVMVPQTTGNVLPNQSQFVPTQIPCSVSYQAPVTFMNVQSNDSSVKFPGHALTSPVEFQPVATGLPPPRHVTVQESFVARPPLLPNPILDGWKSGDIRREVVEPILHHELPRPMPPNPDPRGLMRAGREVMVHRGEDFHHYGLDAQRGSAPAQEQRNDAGTPGSAGLTPGRTFYGDGVRESLTTATRNDLPEWGSPSVPTVQSVQHASFPTTLSYESPVHIRQQQHPPQVQIAVQHTVLKSNNVPSWVRGPVPQQQESRYDYSRQVQVANTSTNKWQPNLSQSLNGRSSYPPRKVEHREKESIVEHNVKETDRRRGGRDRSRVRERSRERSLTPTPERERDRGPGKRRSRSRSSTPLKERSPQSKDSKSANDNASEQKETKAPRRERERDQ
ncbi:hypothetical protein R1sor_000989 [Riccia sorocarpa]|uniref:TFIIS central domain-containing protein n=1 Tax=Riccia sorocarpa TaxID=122646 RepID=A0ABD3GUN7_9MARC